MIENKEPERKVDYDEKELTKDIKRKAIFTIKFFLLLFLISLTITLIWSILK